MKREYPFTAIVGQEDMKKALILNIINPKLNGVLIRGEKGTAKSTAVRALIDILPMRDIIEGCEFSCSPEEKTAWCEDCKEKYNDKPARVKKGRMKLVNLPVGATEDRVVGTIDIEHALKEGEKKFEAGILAQANKNILYVDEVNLLDDHLVDLLLDSAAMGVNLIEREGISFSHPSRFVLIGTMNPEEGDLRPQLIDRFGLVVDVQGERDIENRMEVVKRRLDFEADPEMFVESFKDEKSKLSKIIEKAQEILEEVTYSENCLKIAAEIAIKMGVDGHRADITFIKTAITHAAYRGDKSVNKEDLLVAAKLSLPHRMRKQPFEEGIMDYEEIKKTIQSSAL